MGFLKSLAKTLVDTALVPVDVVKDVATMGGAITDQDEPHTLKRLKKVAGDLEELPDSLED